jgi:hypothetical protein
MPAPSCPACGKALPSRLDGVSSTAYVDYYRCDRCTHVWTTRKSSSDVFSHVTLKALKTPLPRAS